MHRKILGSVVAMVLACGLGLAGEDDPNEVVYKFHDLGTPARTWQVVDRVFLECAEKPETLAKLDEILAEVKAQDFNCVCPCDVVYVPEVSSPLGDSDAEKEGLWRAAEMDDEDSSCSVLDVDRVALSESSVVGWSKKRKVLTTIGSILGGWALVEVADNNDWFSGGDDEHHHHAGNVTEQTCNGKGSCP